MSFYNTGITKIHAEDRVGSIDLTINEPVEGRTITLYKVENEDGTSTEPFKDMTPLQKKNVDTAKNVEAYIKRATDEGASFDSVITTYKNTETLDNVSEGLYLVTQTEVPDGYEAIEPFLVDIPHTTEESQLQYTVTCNPKVDKKIKPAPFTVEPVKSPEPNKSSEKGKTGMNGNPAIYYGAGAVLIGTGIALVAAERKNKKEDEQNDAKE